MPVVVNKDLFDRTSDARTYLVGVTGDISIVGILMGRSVHPVPDTEKKAEDPNDGANDQYTASPSICWLVFAIRVSRRRSSCDLVPRNRVFLDEHKLFSGSAKIRADRLRGYRGETFCWSE